MAFKLSMITDVRDVLRGTKDVEAAMDDVADALDDMAADAQRAGRQAGDALEDIGDDARDGARDLDVISDALDDVADDARRAGRDVGRELEEGTDAAADSADDMVKTFRQVYDEVKKESRQASKVVKEESADSFSRSSENVAEFKDEARSNFSEVASSFTGDMDSAADMVQGTLGGLAGSIAGPVGLAVGAVGAIFGAMYAKANENAELTEERITAMYEDMKESGLNAVSESFITDELDKIYTSAEDARIKYEELGQTARATGIDQATVARAYAGDLEAQEALLEAVRGKLEEVQTMDHADAANYMDDFGDTLGRVQEDLQGVRDDSSNAESRIRDLRAAVIDVPDPNIAVTTSGVWEAEQALNGATYDRYAEFYLQGSSWQAQREADRVASGVRPPTVRVNIAYGMRAV